MEPYAHEQVLAAYTAGDITPEAAVKHCLQYIAALYQARTAANVSHYDLQDKVNVLQTRVNLLQAEVDRLTALVETLLSSGNQASSGQQRQDDP